MEKGCVGILGTDLDKDPPSNNRNNKNKRRPQLMSGSNSSNASFHGKRVRRNSGNRSRQRPPSNNKNNKNKRRPQLMSGSNSSNASFHGKRVRRNSGNRSRQRPLSNNRNNKNKRRPQLMSGSNSSNASFHGKRVRRNSGNRSRQRPPSNNRNNKNKRRPQLMSGSNSSNASFHGKRVRRNSGSRPPPLMKQEIVPLFPSDSNPGGSNNSRRESFAQQTPQATCQELAGNSSQPEVLDSTSQNGHKVDKNAKNGGGNQKKLSAASRTTVDVKLKYITADLFIAEAVTKLPEVYKEDASVSIRRTLVQPFDSLLDKDDVLKVLLGSHNTQKPFATKANIVSCSKFREKRFNLFMETCASILNRADTYDFSESQAVFNLVKATPVWEAALSSDYLLASTFHQLVQYLTQIANQVSGNEVKTFFEKIMSTRLFHPLRGTCVYFVLHYRRNDAKIEILKKFLDCALLVHAPSKCGRILKLLEEVCSREEKFWILALRKSLKFRSSKDDIGALEWKDLPLTPTVNEIMGKVIEDDTNLSPVPVGKAFPSSEHYFDTYVRLLREDCFFEIKTGIKKLLDGTLDHRDMNVYKNVEMLGYVLNDNGVNVLFQMKSSSNITKKGFRKNDLQHGNLLCVSAFGSFKDPVWVTILMRDKEFNDRGVLRFLVELCCYSNKQKIYDILQNLTSRSGQLFVIESPTYYRAYKPILSSLQNSDCDKFPFKEVVIDLVDSGKLPETHGRNLDQQIPQLGVTLDDSQMLAIRHVFENKVSIIQGPPGCGKTFLGVQIVRLLLSPNGMNNQMMPGSNHPMMPGSNHPMMPGMNQSMMPGMNQSMMPGMNQSMMPGMNQSMMPGMNQSMMPGMNQSMMPGMNQSMMPGMNQSMMPGMNQSMMPGMNQSMMPGMNQSMMPGMNQSMMPGMNQSMMPGMNQSMMPGMNQSMMPGMNQSMMPGMTGMTQPVMQPLSLNAPILVLTYKNHALDEFLLQVGASIGLDNVCRVGGRSDEPKLEPVSLRAQKTAQQKIKNTVSMDIRSQIMGLKEEFETASEFLQRALKDLQRSSEINPINFIEEHFSESQLKLLLDKAPHINLDHQAKFKTFKEKNRISREMLNTVMTSIRDAMKEIGIPDLKTALTGETDNDHLFDFKTVVKYAFKTWIPKDNFIKTTEKEFCSVFEETVEVEQPTESSAVNDYDSDDEEEEERFVSFQSNFKDIKEAVKRMNTFSDSQKNSEKALTLLPFAKALCENSSSTILQNTDDVWTLSERCRLIALQSVLQNRCDQNTERCEQLYSDFNKLCEQKFELEERYSAAVALQSKVVAMTITGASLHRRMIESLAPSVVIVEEAAEVLEPQLIAILGPWVKHLVMIGDHKQLPPPVQCYKLAKDYHFDLSMMERLIKGGIPYVSLKFQNRMRPSLSKYLLDIYPELMDGQRVERIPKFGLLKSDIFFWNHASPEVKDRSVTNEEEASRAVKLAMFFITQNVPPKTITILSTYRGQTGLIRRKIDEIQKAAEYKEWIPPTLKREENVQVHTVDMYQGDENEIVIVSLVRSNNENKLGFVKLLNRRCVSQSRAKQAVIFIGNYNTISSGNHWESFLKTLKKESFVSESLTIKCPKHDSSVFSIKDSKNFPPNDYCQVKCEEIMPCYIHVCPKKCKPDHGHELCMKVINYFDIERCTHLRKRECWENPVNVLCKFQCPEKYRCGHTCPKKCEPWHDHLQCKELVSFSCRICSSELKKQCWQKEEEIKCKADVPYTCPVCKKVGDKVCHEDVQLFKCWGTCVRKVLGCGHPCTRLCHQPCATQETCEHCKEIERIKNEQIRKRKLKENELMLKRAKEDLKNAEREQNLVPVFKRERLDPANAEFIHAQDMVLKFIQPTHNWHPTIAFIEKVTNLELSVKFYESITGLIDPSYIAEKFHGTSEAGVNGIVKEGFRLPESKGKNMYGDGVYLASDSSKSAQEMYTKSSNMLLLCKAALGKCKTVTSACNHMTGAKLKKEGFDSLYAKRDSKRTGGVLFDEFVIFNPDRVLPVYIIHYNKSAIPKMNTFSSPLATNNALLQGFGGYSKIELTNVRAASDIKGIHYRCAAGCFYTLKNSRGYTGPQNLKAIFYHSNTTLEDAFEREKAAMERKYPGQPESDYILAFHGTPNDQNIDKIVRENFRMDKIARAAYGHGIYFSEFPDVSLGYAGETMKLLLCKVLPGRSREGSCGTQRGCPCDSHRVGSQGDGRGQMIVMFNPDRILPCYELHLGN